MTKQRLYKNDTGVVVRVRLIPDDSTDTLDNNTGLALRIRKPSGTVQDLAATQDGPRHISVTTGPGNFDEAGAYAAHAIYNGTGVIIHGELFAFSVFDQHTGPAAE